MFPAREQEVTQVASMLLEHWPWTYEDLELLPDNGARYEIIDGNLEMTPPPVNDHAVACAALYDLLKAAAPPELRVLPAAGVHEVLVDSAQQFLVPDVVVVRRTAVAARKRAFAAADVVLAVEVVSPSTRTRDRVTKRDVYARLGIPHYWVVELTPQPALTTFALDESAYAAGPAGSGEELVEVLRPFRCQLVPGRLLD